MEIGEEAFALAGVQLDGAEDVGEVELSTMTPASLEKAPA